MVNTNTYLSTVSFSSLLNWSVQYLLDNDFNYTDKYPLAQIGSFLSRNKTSIDIEDGKEYKRVTIKINNGGVLLRDIEKGENIGTKKQYLVKEGQFVFSRIDARNGAFGIIPKELKGAIVTNDFPVFDINPSVINLEYLVLITTTREFIKYAQASSSGTTNRQRINIDTFLKQIIPLPSLEIQKTIVEAYSRKILLAKQQEEKASILEKEIESYLFEELGIKKQVQQKRKKGLSFVQFKDLNEWGYDKVNLINNDSLKYPLVSLDTRKDIYIDLFRGKSPKYDINSKFIILNQKCNRWNNIELEHARTVKEKWLQSVDEHAFTQRGDILINSTGEGTIGRASCIEKEEHTGLLYDSHILLLRFDQKQIIPLFFTFLFNSSFGQLQVDSIKSAQSTKQTELGINNLKKIQFPIPSLEVQNKITSHIIKIKEQINTLLQQSEQNSKQAIKEFENTIFD